MASELAEGLLTARCERGFGSQPRRMERQDTPATQPTLFLKVLACDRTSGHHSYPI